MLTAFHGTDLYDSDVNIMQCMHILIPEVRYFWFSEGLSRSEVTNNIIKHDSRSSFAMNKRDNQKIVKTVSKSVCS